jgi:uncharacterized protein (DUF2236 family)
LSEFRDYVATTARTLVVSDTARELSRPIFWPSGSPVHARQMELFRLISFGSLPPAVRAQFEYRWSPVHELALRSAFAAGPALAPLLEAVLVRLADDNGRAVATLMSIGGFPPERSRR